MRISDWSSDVCSSDLLALSKDREDLAKAALLEKQKAADMAAQMKVEIATLDEALKANEEDIKKLQAKLRHARARQNSIVTRQQRAHNSLRVRELYAGEKMQDAYARFDFLERRVYLAASSA